MTMVLFAIQLIVTLVVGIYFYRQLQQQKKAQPTARRESAREMERLTRMRAIRLSEPLSERVRPAAFEDIIGQEDGVKSLKAILCGHMHITIEEEFSPTARQYVVAGNFLFHGREVLFV